MSEVWWVNAFVGPDADGNATAVVVDDRADVDWDRWALARALRAPDTVFVAAESANAQAAVRFFSPHEGEMTFCGQGLIAADAVMRARSRRALTHDAARQSQAAADDAFTLLTATGSVRTRADSEDPGVHWFEVPAERVSAPTPSDATTPLAAPTGSAALVDSGRKRLFIRLESALEVSAIALAPEAVIAFCSERGLSGVCFYAVLAARRVALRVFTVSLNGREDATTGGAVLALARLLPGGNWEIAQGEGHRLCRGRLLLRHSPSNAVIAVGGRVTVVASGRVDAGFIEASATESKQAR